jgi:ribosomal protein S8E
VTFVPPGFTRKPPKYERFIRPTGLRMSKAHVTHPELKATFQLAIIGVKKNPNGQAYTGLGVITKGTCARKGACHSGSGSGSSGSGRLRQRCLRCNNGLFQRSPAAFQQSCAISRGQAMLGRHSRQAVG